MLLLDVLGSQAAGWVCANFPIAAHISVHTASAVVAHRLPMLPLTTMKAPKHVSRVDIAPSAVTAGQGCYSCNTARTPRYRDAQPVGR